MADEQPQAGNQSQANTDRQILLQKIYIKDLSFESPKTPQIFTMDAQAATNLNIGSSNRQIDADHVEVSLTLTIDSRHNDETIFLIEIVQAGVFVIKGYTDQERGALLGSFCPGTLFPFAREAVADIALKGGFPQLLLQPINFDALYAQALQQQAAQQQANASGQPLQVQMPGADTNLAQSDASPAADAADTENKGGGEPH
jgi:preprotein translocase subunit SecB